MVPAERASLLGSFTASSVVNSFITPSSSFHQSRSNSLGYRTHVLLRLFLALDTYGDVSFICDGGSVYIVAPILNIIFRGLISLGWFPR